MAYHFAQSEILPRRTLAACGIVLLHLGVIYLLATALMSSLATPVPPALVARFIPEPVPEVAPAPRVKTPALRHASLPAVVPPAAPRVVPPEAAPPAPPVVERPSDADTVVAPEPVRMLGRNVLPDSEDYYPPERRRLGIEGAALVRVCVDVRGTRSGEPLIEESSQDAQLDAAALNVARHGRYVRSEQGGVAVPNCYRFHIVFRQAGH